MKPDKTSTWTGLRQIGVPAEPDCKLCFISLSVLQFSTPLIPKKKKEIDLYMSISFLTASLFFLITSNQIRAWLSFLQRMDDWSDRPGTTTFPLHSPFVRGLIGCKPATSVSVSLIKMVAYWNARQDVCTMHPCEKFYKYILFSILYMCLNIWYICV